MPVFLPRGRISDFHDEVFAAFPGGDLGDLFSVADEPLPVGETGWGAKIEGRQPRFGRALAKAGGRTNLFLLGAMAEPSHPQSNK
jgi:hypothetical protein